MSVYLPRKTTGERKSPFYYYDFVCRGVRFHGSTGTGDKREAEKFEKRKRQEVSEALKRHEDLALKRRPMTVHDACTRYWVEVGQHAATADDIWTYLGRIELAFGRDTPLSELTSAKISLAVSRRRADMTPGRNPKPVSAATVNRTFTEPLRRVLRRAKEVWLEALPPVGWRDLILPEPRERVREASDVEEERLLRAVREDYRPAIEFMLVSGCRLEEVVGLTWDRVMWTAGALRILGKGRRGASEQERLIPITGAIREILWPLRHHHPEAVFTYVARRANASRWIKPGDRVPVTYEGLKTQWQRDREASGIRDFRLHDTRHTALTRLVRKTGNLKIAQKLAGHSDINTTAKYAHAHLDDLKSAMESVEADRPTTEASPGNFPGKSANGEKA